MKTTHQHEKWQLEEAADGSGLYCKACGESIAPPCLLCHEAIGPNEEARPISDGHGPKLAHRECLLRSVLGGIGHLEDHQHWCNEVGDPDGGRSYRQSALEVDEWVMKHGLP